MLHTQVCTYKNKLPGPTITAKSCTQIPNRRRKIFCIDYLYPFVSPFQCWARSDTPSSTCKFIIPPALKPKTNIETGMQGVCDTLNLCRIVSACRCRCCFICSVHWPFVLGFGAQRATSHAKFFAEYPTVSLNNQHFVLVP